jgi:recombination protein RecT
MSNNLRNTVATQQAQQAGQAVSIGQFLHDMTPQIALALPKGMDADRIYRIALTVIRKEPKFLQCNRDSLAGALLTASSFGLEVGNDEAYLVPFGKECTLIIGYQGLAKLFWQHPLASLLSAEVVYEKDDFSYQKGLDPFLRHTPSMDEDRGKIRCYYAAAKLSTGASSFLVLTPPEIKELRAGKVGPDSRFKGGDPQHWMEKKTCIRQLVKLLPKSSQFAQAIEADEKPGHELYQELVKERKILEAAPAHDPAPADVDTSTGEVTETYASVDVDEQEPPEREWK